MNLIAIGIAYLIMGSADDVIKRIGGNRNPQSIRIYKSLKIGGSVMLASGIFSLFFNGLWELAYLIGVGYPAWQVLETAKIQMGE